MILGFNKNIFIFDINNEKLLKIFEIKNIKNFDLKKWQCPQDNEFIIFSKGIILLFELNNDNEDNEDNFKLNILSQLYLPKFENFVSIKKINDNKNLFCFYGNDYYYYLFENN